MSRYFRRKRYCKFTAEGIDQIDYKDLKPSRNTSPKPARSFPAG